MTGCDAFGFKIQNLDRVGRCHIGRDKTAFKVSRYTTGSMTHLCVNFVYKGGGYRHVVVLNRSCVILMYTDQHLVGSKTLFPDFHAREKQIERKGESLVKFIT